METAAILLEHADCTDEHNSFLLDGIRFIYADGDWTLVIKDSVYAVSELVASQVAYALTVLGDVDVIMESLENDRLEIETTSPQELQGIPFEEWEEREARKSMVAQLFKKNKSFNLSHIYGSYD